MITIQLTPEQLSRIIKCVNYATSHDLCEFADDIIDYEVLEVFLIDRIEDHRGMK